jgi:hypothetical protein
MDRSTFRFLLFLFHAFIQSHPPSRAPTVGTSQISAPRSGSKIPSPQCHHECDVDQSASVGMVAFECAPEMIGSEMTQQADGHFDLLGVIPINTQSQNMILQREKQ